MYVDANKVAEMLGEHTRFVSPFNVPPSYCICTDVLGSDEEISAKAVEEYWKKLAYVVEHAEELIKGAFRTCFYDFYGVDRNKIGSPEEMCNQLIFDSFVFAVKEKEVGAYLTNEEFMFGHFIEVRWDVDWNLIYAAID